MSDIVSKFNITIVREVFLLADPKHAAMLQKLLKPLNFLSLREGREFRDHRDQQHFVVAVCDFTNAKTLQSVAKIFSEMDPLLAHRVIYASAPDNMRNEYLLFSQEIGARYLACGITRQEDLRNYLKRICLEAHQVGPLENYEADLAKASKANDKTQILALIERLRALPQATEEVCRLLVMAYQQVGDLKRAESYLKQLLRLNDQNLWAANHLGRLFLRSGRVSEGVEVLRRISHFHNLNGERLLTLGDAYVKAGFNKEAQEAFDRGDMLNEGEDERFKQGMAKVMLSEQNYDDALNLLGNKPLSQDLISFLNMRAILSIKQNQIQQSFGYYQQAIKGCGDDQMVRAKLLFNMGLAYVRFGDLDKAEETFNESVIAGGPNFKRADGPLSIVKKVKEAKRKNEASPNESPNDSKVLEMMEDSEWEALY